MDFEHKMTKNEWIMFNHQKKLDKVIEHNRYYCHCGHSVTILPNESKVFCTYCGHWVFKNKKEEFMYRLKETMKHGREKDII